MEPLPIVPPSCALSSVELKEQLGRYRVVGGGAEIMSSDERRLVVRVADAVPDSAIGELVEVERACCPFFDLTWDRASRCLEVSVSAGQHEPALDAIRYALGMAEPAPG